MSDPSDSSRTPVGSGVTWSIVCERLMVVARGHYGLEEVRRALNEGARSAPASPHRGMILDVTASRENRSSEELRVLATDLARHREAIAYRCAVLVSDSLRYGLGRMLGAFCEPLGVTACPFRDAAEAREWLRGGRTPG